MNRIFPENRWTRKNIPCLGIREDDTEFYQVDWVSGAAALIRREATEEIGYFDERFFMYWEDADLCQRMKKAGWDVVYCPNPEVTHLVGRCTEQNVVVNLARFHKSAFLLEQKQERNRWPGYPVLVALALEFHFLVRLLCKGVQGRTRRGKAGVLPDKTKVLRIIARLNIGGPAIHVAVLTHGLDPTIFESTLIAGTVSRFEGDMTYLVDTSDRKPIIISELQRELNLKKDVKSLFRLLKILGQEKPDIVHTHTAKAGAIGRIAVFLHNLTHTRKVLAVHTFHGHVFRGYFSKLQSLFFVGAERMLAKITDVIITLSEGQKSELRLRYHIARANKFRNVNLGFDLQPFLSAERSGGQFRKSLGVDGNSILIGIVGRLVPIKNHKVFLKAAKLFLEENPDIRIIFLIVGDGELRNDLMAYCKQQGLSRYVRFCGWQTDLPKVYADLDILALSSINEGTPVSIIEAMASSVPVISTDAGGVRDLLGATVQHVSSNGFQVRERGILCEQGNAEALAAGLGYLVENHSRLKTEMSERARLFVEQNFLKERLLQDMESLYLELMAKGKRRHIEPG